MKTKDFNVGQKFNYHGKTYTITRKAGYPACPSIRVRWVEDGYFFLSELQEWLAAGLIEFVK